MSDALVGEPARRPSQLAITLKHHHHQYHHTVQVAIGPPKVQIEYLCRLVLITTIQQPPQLSYNHHCHKYATTMYHHHYMWARRNGRRVETAEMAEMAKILRSKIPFIITPTHIISPTDKSISALPGLHWCSCIASAQN